MNQDFQRARHELTKHASLYSTPFYNDVIFLDIPPFPRKFLCTLGHLMYGSNYQQHVWKKNLRILGYVKKFISSTLLFLVAFSLFILISWTTFLPGHVSANSLPCHSETMTTKYVNGPYKYRTLFKNLLYCISFIYVV